MKDDTQRATSRATERANGHLQGHLLAGSDTLALSPQTPGHGTEDILSGLQLKPQTRRGEHGQRPRQARLWYPLAPCGVCCSSQPVRW